MAADDDARRGQVEIVDAAAWEVVHQARLGHPVAMDRAHPVAGVGDVDAAGPQPHHGSVVLLAAVALPDVPAASEGAVVEGRLVDLGYLVIRDG